MDQQRLTTQQLPAKVPFSSEVHLSTSPKTRLASAIWMAMSFAGQFTDLILKEGCRPSVKSDKGTVDLAELNIGAKEHFDFKITRVDIENFYGYFVKNLEHGHDAAQYWREHVQEKFKATGRIAESKRADNSDSFIRYSLNSVDRGILQLTVRVTPPPRPIGESGLPNELIDKIIDGECGIIILTGPTGSGKTATAYSVVDHLNGNTRLNIITIEEPIEFAITKKRSSFSQREVGMDVPTYAQGLTQALRGMSPDILLIGEVTDSERGKQLFWPANQAPWSSLPPMVNRFRGHLPSCFHLLVTQSRRLCVQSSPTRY